MKNNFMYVSDAVNTGPDSKHERFAFPGPEDDAEFLILASNINHQDPWLWKFCVHENNFTPVWSNEYGNCNIPLSGIDKAMAQANEWINYTDEHSGRDRESILYLCRVK